MSSKKTTKKGGAYDENNIDSKRILYLLLDVLFTMIHKSKTCLYRKSGIMSNTREFLKKSFLQSKYKKYGIMDITSSSTVFIITEDFDSLMNGSPIGKKTQTRYKVNNKIVSQAVNFIIQKELIIITSWGNREFNLSQSEKNYPTKALLQSFSVDTLE